jgi:hypothetical protein
LLKIGEGAPVSDGTHLKIPVDLIIDLEKLTHLDHLLEIVAVAAGNTATINFDAHVFFSLIFGLSKCFVS